MPNSTLRSSAHHLQRLAAFEDEDPSVIELQSKISNFQLRQQKESRKKNKYYEWVQTRRKLCDAEASLNNQIHRACTNLVGYIENEESCSGDPNSRLHAMKSIQEDIKVLQKPAQQGIEVLSTLSGDGPRRNLDHLHSLMEDFDDKCNNMLREINEHRQKVPSLISGSKNEEGCLPLSLCKAIASLHSFLRENTAIEDGGEIHKLELDLRKKFEDARISYESKSASSRLDDKTNIKHNIGRKRISKAEAILRQYKKKCREIEQKGLKEAERLRMAFVDRSNRARVSMKEHLNRKEISVRLQTMRIEREDNQKIEEERRLQVLKEKISDDHEKEVLRTRRILETKQTLHARQLEKGRENINTNDLHEDYANEITGIKHKRLAKERTSYRQEQSKIKTMAQKKVEEEALRAEEIRLAKLTTLAASVPYYDKIMDKTADIFKSTSSRKNDVYGGPSKLADFQSNNLKSFTDEKMFQNANFRLGNALHASGLAHSTYARDVVRNAIPRSEARTTFIKPY